MTLPTARASPKQGPSLAAQEVLLTDLYKHGHEVTALFRDHDQADIVAARGAIPTVVDLYDRPRVVSLFRAADGAIHTASPGDATSADLDSAVVDAAIDAYAGTGKPFIEISGLWIYGANTSITEESPFQAPALVAWKEPIARRVLAVTCAGSWSYPASAAEGFPRPEPVLMVVNEGDHHGSRGSSSRAKKLEAAKRISLARFSSRTSASNYLIFCASPLLVPRRFPASMSACLHQPRKVSAFTPTREPIRCTA